MNNIYSLKNNRLHKHKTLSLSRRDIARDILRNDNGKFNGIKEYEFNKIIGRILELKVNELYNDGLVDLGYGLGEIYLKISNRNTNKIQNFAIDWNKTLNLWLENNKAKEDKKLVRMIDFKKCISFVWNHPLKPNLKYYSFKPLRSLRKQVYFDVINNKSIMSYE